jgi:hypothetical protein
MTRWKPHQIAPFIYALSVSSESVSAPWKVQAILPNQRTVDIEATVIHKGKDGRTRELTVVNGQVEIPDVCEGAERIDIAPRQAQRYAAAGWTCVNGTFSPAKLTLRREIAVDRR